MRLRSRAALASLVLCAVPPLARDPYSFGYIGGDFTYLWGPGMEVLPNHPWQRVATAMLLALLLAGSAAIMAGRVRLARVLITGETVAFLALNAIYLGRDGTLRFQDRTYFHTEEPLWMTVGGLLLRLAVLLVMTRVVRRGWPDEGCIVRPAVEPSAAPDAPCR